MSKTKKKRNKAYRGQDAKPQGPSNQPQVHQYKAVQRTALGEWWHARRKLLKPVIISALVIIFIVWLIVSFITNLT